MPTITVPLRYSEVHKSTHTDSWYPGTTVTYQNVDVQQLVDNNQRILQDDKDWKLKIAKGQDAVNPYTLRRARFFPCRVRIQTDYTAPNGRRMVSTGSHSFGHSPFDRLVVPVDAALKDQALASFKRKIRSNVGKKDLVVPAVELRELRGLVKQVALMGVETIKSLISLKKGNLTPLTKQISDVWLMFGFGVDPLLTDISEVAKAIQNYLDRADHTVRLSSRASKTWFEKGGEGPRTGGIHYSLYTSCQRLHKLSYVYTGGFDFQVRSSDDYSYGAQEIFGLSPKELPALLWELTAFSWVADYVTNIGVYLEDTFDVPAGASKYMCLSTLYTVEGEIHPTPVLTQKGALITSQTVLPGTGNLTYFKRETVSALPRVGLHLKSVDQIGQGVLTKLANLGSILVKGIDRRALDFKVDRSVYTD